MKTVETVYNTPTKHLTIVMVHNDEHLAEQERIAVQRLIGFMSASPPSMLGRTWCLELGGYEGIDHPARTRLGVHDPKKSNSHGDSRWHVEKCPYEAFSPYPGCARGVLASIAAL